MFINPIKSLKVDTTTTTKTKKTQKVDKNKTQLSYHLALTSIWRVRLCVSSLYSLR